jgi:hypothetical protein
MTKKFRIRLHDLHEKSGLTAYAVAKETGLIENTVRKYVTEEVVSERIYNYVVTLAEFYGVDWLDVVDVIEETEENDTPEMKTPLLTVA